ncbi:hypothetical protein GCM10009737_12160 [Nocardioides lentus]|uniref:Transposase n=1 Tax=Nocardioides lentus TaxID=338077 RepID=A0ABN2P8A1_9ACTN
MPADPLLAAAEELYGLLPGEFTAARDARAKELKADDADLAARVRRLKRPSSAAWVLNLLVRRESGQVDEVLAVGRALREAQEGLDGAALRQLTAQRRQLTAAVTTRARRLARESGHRVTDAVAEQVEASLTAAMVDEACAAVVRSGLLVAAVSATAPGLTDPADPVDAAAVPAAAGFVPRAVEGPPAPDDGADGDGTRGGGPDLRVVPDPDAEAKARAAAQEALDEADEVLAEAEQAAGGTDEAVADLEARGLQLSSEMDELRRRLAELEEQAEETDEALEQAEESQGEAHEALAAARRDRDAAAAALDALS